MAHKGRLERRAPHKSEIRKRGKGYQAMKRTGNRLAVMTVAGAPSSVSIGVSEHEFCSNTVGGQRGSSNGPFTGVR